MVVACLGIAALAALAVYGARAPLSEPDEARYAEIAREMAARHDWVSPHLNFVKYFEKPPLVYWGTALAFAAFGETELAARLPSVLSGLATVLVAVWLAARMYDRTTAFLTLPIVALGPLFGLLTQVLTLDMSLTFFIAAAMAAIWCGWSAAQPRDGRAWPTARAWYRAAYVAAACAVLVKGPVAAVLVGGAGVLFLVLHGGWRALRVALDWRGALLALLIVMPWFVLVSWRNPEFLHFFVVDQHLARYLWTKEHGEAIWFYLPQIPIAIAPFGVLLLFDPGLLRAALAPRSWTPATRFLVIWAATIVVFFSLSTSKLLTYILPAIPPIAMLAARAITLAWARGRTAGLSRLAWLLLIGGPIMGLCGAVLPFFVDHWRMPVLASRLCAGGPVLLVTGWLIRRELALGRRYMALTVLALGWFAGLTIAVSGREAANDYRALALAARAAMRPGDRLAMYNHVMPGIPFYAKQRVIMVRNVGELQFGRRLDDDPAWFWKTDDDLRRAWSEPGRLFMVINRAELAKINPPLSPAPITMATKDRKDLIVNR
jgi:4-amino-4-deoxy-L-arabinose transferase-like glycosyltransferase